MRTKIDRRALMRGTLAGAGAVTVGVPLLDYFLNENGTAMAAGTPLPTRFGSFFWGLGLTPGRWVPQKVGAGYEITPELESLRALKDKVSVFSGFRVHLDGRPNFQHWTGQAAVMSGIAPSRQKTFDNISFDTIVADTIGGGARFRSIELTPFGNPSFSYSTRGENSFNPAEATPISLYTRLFGEGFQDPNAGGWKPDPRVMLKQSALSAVKAQREDLIGRVGKSDKDRLDQYFTSVRQMEQQLDVELQQPAPAQACRIPVKPEESRPNGEVRTVQNNNRLMADLMAMALACNQTKVFNVVFTSATSELYLPGDSSIYHQHTHEEAIDDKLGYQPLSSKLAFESVKGYAEFLTALDAVKEGDGTLLDRSLVLGYSDTGYAKIHSTDNIPMFIAGGANGRHKGGIHVTGAGDPVTRVVLTAQQALGMPAGSWGIGAMQTGKSASEVLV
jgi:hypothetical protein